MPMLFSQSSSDGTDLEEKRLVSQNNICCIALVFEKSTRKRTYAKS